MEWRVRPISTWPGTKTRVQRPSSFGRRGQSMWRQTIETLERELAQLRARDVILELDVEERHIRQDGWIRASAAPKYSGVILSFYSNKLKGPLRYPCDAFRKWEDNVRAIALALEALRKVDRYGVTTHNEQYAGWKALPATTTTTMTTEAAAKIISENSRDGDWTVGWANLLEGGRPCREAVRRAQFATHPDHGGTLEAFDDVQQAKQTLVAAGVLR